MFGHTDAIRLTNEQFHSFIKKYGYLMKDDDKSRVLNDNMHLTAKPLYKNINIPFENLHRIVKSNYRQYSPFVFENRLKKSENWNNDKQNLLILDVDSGLTINEAREKFKDYKYFICTTKSHQKEKKGVMCDRFRIIFESNNIPKGDQYFDFCRELEVLLPFIDKQVNTKTGAFLGYSDCEYWYNDGKLFNCDPLLNMAIDRKKIKKDKPKFTKPQYNNFENKEELPLEEIKNRLTREVIADIVSSRGFEVNRKFMFKYRQDERTPSASISPDGLIKDFGSELSTDAIGFIQEVDQVDFRTAVEIVGGFVNLRVA
jgi:hypothetical protein